MHVFTSVCSRYLSRFFLDNNFPAINNYLHEIWFPRSCAGLCYVLGWPNLISHPVAQFLKQLMILHLNLDDNRCILPDFCFANIAYSLLEFIKCFESDVSEKWNQSKTYLHRVCTHHLQLKKEWKKKMSALETFDIPSNMVWMWTTFQMKCKIEFHSKWHE